jgi:RHS repeat-associated protein
MELPVMNSGVTLSDFNMTGSGHYDGAGNLLGQTASMSGAPASYSGSTTYAYNGIDELTHEQSNRLGSYTNVFAYDNAGNPTTWKGAAQTYNNDNQNLAQGYDQDGNPTSWQGNALTFDSANHLTSVGAVLTAGYNAEGLRAWKQNASGYTYFIYDGLVPIAEVSSGGAVQAVNSWGADGLASRRNVSSNSSVFYTFDAQGNTVQRLDGSGNILGSYGFDAFGVRASTDNSTDPYSGFGAQWGYYRDSETGLSLLGHRYYDATQGRFLSRDPIGYDGGLNLYAYTASNPLTSIDPTGDTSVYIPGFGDIHGHVNPDEWRQRQKNNQYPPSIPGDDLEKDCDFAKQMAHNFSQPPILPLDEDGPLIPEPTPFLLWFAGMVRPHGPWDFKSHVNPSKDPEGWLNYDEYGNFHFGATGAAGGISLDLLLRGAGVAQYMTPNTDPAHWGYPWQGPPYGDDPPGQYWVQQGYNWYVQHHPDQ